MRVNKKMIWNAIFGLMVSLFNFNGSGWGGRFYDPNTDIWRKMSSKNAPLAGTLVWTGIELIARGAMNSAHAGGIYAPAF